MIISYRCLLLALTGLALIESSVTEPCDFRINNGPLITPCVSEITLQKGQNYTLTCKGVTKLRFRQQDASEEVTSNFTIVNTSKTIDEKEFSFQRTLELFNVDQYAIGYYACSDETVDENIVNSITEEPENNEHVSYIYLYVNGTGSLFAPMRELILSRSNKILIECRPSIPEVEVNLTSPDIAENVHKRYNPKLGFTINYDVNSNTHLNALNMFSCDFRTKDKEITKYIFVKHVSEPPEPVIETVPKRFLKGDNFSLTCKVNIKLNTNAVLSWRLPQGLNVSNENIEVTTNAGNITVGEMYSTITIYNATKKHAGSYKCVSSNSCMDKQSNNVLKEFIEKPFLFFVIKNSGGLTRQRQASIRADLDAHPEVNYFKVLKNGITLPYNETSKYKLEFKNDTKLFMLTINPVNVADTANYTFIVGNGKLVKNYTHKLEVAGPPTVKFDKSRMTCVKGTKPSFRCDVSGYPLPNVTWLFSYSEDNETRTLELMSTSEISLVYNKTAFLDFQKCDKEGSITCIATIVKINASETRELFVYEMFDGFGIFNKSENGQKWVRENDLVSVKCLASKHEFSNVKWLIDDKIDSTALAQYPNQTDLSLVAELKINKITLDHSGSYTCVGTKNDGSTVDDFIEIKVLKLQPPVIYGHADTEQDVFRFDNIRLNCTVAGVPLPEIKWYKDGELKAANFTNVKIYQNNLNRTTVNATIFIEKMQPANVGKWECVATSGNVVQRKSFALKLKVEKEVKSFTHYLIAIAVIMLTLIILIVYLTVKIKKEKRFRKELAAAGLLYFKEGVINSLNPDLGIDEQAELLPYDEKFEFPREKLNLGIQLGAGAFGIVYKAEARGIINAEESTTVAVKMVKKTADNMYIKALASELKIMVHLGKHINIVNLLGACTKNVVKRELVVIVEYCKYGNIHNYMQRHREVFIDQLDTGNKDKLGKVNRAYTTTSSGSTGVNSDYFGSNNTQDTDHTFVNTANTVPSGRKNGPNNQQMEEVKASEGYLQPEWRSNYVSDYSYDGRSPRPLSSRDLLAWSFQIARGMEYLASRKVLHGDLAARNILLADDNIVKICDFGLAKSIYKNDEYQKKENCPLPVKWLAIECMTDRIFSTQSDVWSFGIVLWELFTLAKTPYPNIHPASLLPFLSEGHRLDKPTYADDRLYDVMKKCWEAKPTFRPTFSQLQELLGTFLEDNVRNHYVDLNSTYMDKNAKAGTQEDYLDMMCAPDYNNLVTPSPHHYVNTDAQKSFFPPTPVKVDDEGYLQMSPTNQGIFSPRNPNSEFDFDPRKFNTKTSEAGSCGSELTPMLTLNNLPARSGSESDHEGNAPYLNVCTPIEELDEVFAPSLDETKNAKNMQSAVTNPTYITFDNINEKPKDIINYVNINVPNGLVK